MHRFHTQRRLTWLFGLLFPILIQVPVPVHAADLTIAVVEIDARGQALGPVAGASVCYNSADGCAGSKGSTGADGRIVFADVPAGAFTVKAWKTGYTGNVLTFDVTAKGGVQQIAIRQGIGPALACLQPPAFQVGPAAIQSLAINGGAPATASRDVALTFTTTGGAATAYRIAEPEPDVLFPGSITSKPFIPIPCNAVGSNLIRHTLNLTSNYGSRYGNRLVALQIKSGTNISNIATDAIRLDPAALRDYVLTGRDKIQQVLDFAAANGFRHTAPIVVETCESGCGGGLLELTSKQGCLNLVRGVLFQDRALNPLWNIKDIGDLHFTQDLPASDPFQNTSVTSSSLEINEDVFRIEFKVMMPMLRVMTSALGMKDIHICTSPGTGFFQRMVISGPAEDDFADAANPWKNAFIRR